jgi:fermentation-respiration switch protein FrsA (DUF1100 family)
MLAAALAIPAAGCANSMFYWPTREVYCTPASYGLRYESVDFRSADGTRLSGWFVPALGAPLGTVVHFHGNAQNMTAHFPFVAWLPAEGFNVFTFDYRGYGSSEGKPGRKGVYQDCVAALDYVRGRRDVDTDAIVVLGQSLGGANAIAVLGGGGTPEVRAVAIDSSFYSYRLIAQDKIGQIPVLSLLRRPLAYLLVTDGLSPGPFVEGVSPTPLLVFHSTDDQVVPYRHAQMLYASAGEPKQLVTIPGGRHTDALTRPDPQWRRCLVDFYIAALKRLPPAAR